MRRTSTAALALAALLTVAACGTETDSPDAGGDTPTGPEQETTPGDAGETEDSTGDPSGDPGDSTGDPGASPDHPDGEVLADTRGGGHFLIDSLTVRQAESDPVQLFLDVEGNAPTPCHTVAYQVEQDADTFLVHLTTVEQGEMMCTQVLVPYELTVPLGETDTFPVTIDVNDGDQVLTVNG